MAANSAKDRVFQQFSITERSAKGVACEISERSESRKHAVLYGTTGRKGRCSHTCKTLSSGLGEASFWPKNGLRSNLIDSKFQKFSGGACPQTPLAGVCVSTHH